MTAPVLSLEDLERLERERLEDPCGPDCGLDCWGHATDRLTASLRSVMAERDALQELHAGVCPLHNGHVRRERDEAREQVRSLTDQLAAPRLAHCHKCHESPCVFERQLKGKADEVRSLTVERDQARAEAGGLERRAASLAPREHGLTALGPDLWALPRTLRAVEGWAQEHECVFHNAGEWLRKLAAERDATIDRLGGAFDARDTALARLSRAREALRLIDDPGGRAEWLTGSLTQRLTKAKEEGLTAIRAALAEEAPRG